MSRETSPRPMSDDSAIGSIANSGLTRTNHPPSTSTSNINSQSNQSDAARSHGSNNPSSDCSKSRAVNGANGNGGNGLSPRNKIISPQELEATSKQMRHKNTTLLSRSIRTNLSCFNDLDIQRLNYDSDYLVNFVSLGINKSPHALQRPVSILWPDTYEKMIHELSELDAYLINTEYKEKPIEWMLSKGLTVIPDCKYCKEQMTLKYERTTVSWRCSRTQACQNLYAPIQRPIFFKGYESVGLLKILFSIYYWSICTQCELLYAHLKMDAQTLYGIWQSIQNVCRVALEKSYPRFRLCNNPNSDENQNNSQIAASSELIDLISIKVNSNYIVCAKHPRSNQVRLGLWVPKVSKYSFTELVDSWFAHGAQLRVCEKKFLDLTRKRADLKVFMTTRSEMACKNGAFHRESAFGYLICQLSHIFKDFDSSQVSLETLKLILAELEWRELYGTNPYDAFTKIVEHMALYRGASECYFEPIPEGGTVGPEHEVHLRDQSEYVFAEKYFYAKVHPKDSQGNVIQRFNNKEDNGKEDLPAPIIQFRCHLCSYQFESFYFSMHMVAHVEHNRKEDEHAEYTQTRHIKCKHCFRRFKKDDVIEHAKLFRLDYHTIQFGCRICCIKYPDRARYLEHMRRNHFEHEMPYRCPTCKFASSFQRDLIIHFQEEHQREFVIFCPFCLRGWTIAEPEKLDRTRMDKVSLSIYNHILEHYALANTYSCDNCCLSFLTRDKLKKHQALHHNPSEIFSEKEVKFEPFIVTRIEEPHCVEALQMEFFIPNKRPNLAIEEAFQATASATQPLEDSRKKKSRPALDESGASTSFGFGRLKSFNEDTGDSSSSSSSDSDSVDVDDADDDDDDDDDDESTYEDGLASLESDTIHVRPSTNTRRFLDNGEAAMHLPKNKSTGPSELTTEKILEYMSKLRRADCVIPNQSVILTPSGRPARCLECSEYITVDHYVAAIKCRPCKYVTHCPIAATKHKQSRHPNNS